MFVAGSHDAAALLQALAEVIEHIRLLQISSEVFAKEVEPTGLLTMEQTLARCLSVCLSV